MLRTRICSWGLVAIAPLTCLLNAGATRATLVASAPGAVTQTAQLFYPPADTRNQGISVMGYGMAVAPADTAKLQLQFVSAESPDPSTPFPATGENTLTPEQLQPIVDALIAAGVPAEAIEQTSSTQSFVFFNFQAQQMTISLTQPTSTQLKKFITLVQDTLADMETVALANTTVQYFVDDCQSLTAQAYAAAIADAQHRAGAIATELGITLETVPSVAESPIGLLSFTAGSTCDAAPLLALPFNINLNLPQADLQAIAPPTVQLRRDLFVTFAIQD